MATGDYAGKALPLHDLENVNTVLGMLYDKDGVYLPDFRPEDFYNRILLDTLKYGEENYVHLKYADTINVKAGQTTAKFRRWAGLTPTIQPLREGIPPAPDKHAYETIEVGNVFSFGRWSEYTDRVDLSIINDVTAERSMQYGELANQTKELYARKTWLASPNEFYANFKDFSTLGFGDHISLDDLRFLMARMRRMLVKPIGGKFNYICSTEFINGLIDDPRVKQFMELEQTTGKLWGSGEPFDMFELKFIPTMLDEFAYPDTEFPGVYEIADNKEIIRLYAMDSTKVYYIDVHQNFVVSGADKCKKQGSTIEYLSDGTAIENMVRWELPVTEPTALTAENVLGTGEATDAKVVIRTSTITTKTDAYGNSYTEYGDLTDATADFAKFNTLIEGGDFMQLPVNRGIFFGMEAMAKIAIAGISEAPKIIIKELGSAGTLDPLNQRQSIGFKVDGFGLAIKRPEAMCVTYGIPKFAEMAALTNKIITGDYTLLDGLKDDSTQTNRIGTGGVGVLRVDGLNSGTVSFDGSVNGKDSSGDDVVTPIILEKDILNGGDYEDGNDTTSNIK